MIRGFEFAVKTFADFFQLFFLDCPEFFFLIQLLSRKPIWDKMTIFDAINNAKTLSDLNIIFDRRVTVILNNITDAVFVEDFKDKICSDAIASKIRQLVHDSYHFQKNAESKHLAESIFEKVVIPLKKLISSLENKGSIYQLFATDCSSAQNATAVAEPQLFQAIGLLDDNIKKMVEKE